eukprot:6184637-Pleurochrysis_carterae.AAC.2
MTKRSEDGSSKESSSLVGQNEAAKRADAFVPWEALAKVLPVLDAAEVVTQVLLGREAAPQDRVRVQIVGVC